MILAKDAANGSPKWAWRSSKSAKLCQVEQCGTTQLTVQKSPVVYKDRILVACTAKPIWFGALNATDVLSKTASTCVNCVGDRNVVSSAEKWFSGCSLSFCRTRWYSLFRFGGNSTGI